MDEMIEETNRPDEDFDDLFGDETTEETPEASEETPPEGGETGAAAGETNPEAEKPATVRVKHLGQEMELSMDELIANAQKGLDYDHVREERDQLRQSPEISLLDRLSKAAGMTRSEYVAAVEQRQKEQEIAAQMQRGIPEEAARRLQKLEEAETRREAEERAREAAQVRNQDLMDFIKAYPDVQEFPEEVLAAISKGEKPLYAYQAYENRQLKTKLAAFQKNEENKQKTAGSMKGSGTPEEADAFSSGFDSAF